MGINGVGINAAGNYYGQQPAQGSTNTQQPHFGNGADAYQGPSTAKKKGIFGRLFQAGMLALGSIVGIFAFKKIAPGLSAKAAEYIPEFGKNLFGKLEGSSFGQTLQRLTGSAIEGAQGLIGKATSIFSNTAPEAAAESAPLPGLSGIFAKLFNAFGL